MENKTVLLTGASSGVGKSLSYYLHDRGYDLVLVSRREPEILHEHGNERIAFVPADLGDVDASEKQIDDIVAGHGHIPYVINNAGVMTGGNLDEHDWENVEQDINVNARMPWYIMKRVLPEMRKQNFGRIINVTSGAPLNCFPGFGIYSATKGLLNSLTVTMAKENREYNIKINLMSPGPVKSEMAPKAPMEPEVCHPTLDYLLQLPESGETGRFYWLGYEVPLFPDLEGVQWLKGIGNEKLKKVL
ncbi:SDR family NAD(P)-dependent oxidoreductase [Natronogracilivirga saccharolytica]|uniref:SDR family oxidoreductase n=1 Tax=Natronogracilivirga saccharolytica TaxID=2812953 RepID=A0A8J7UWS6_9BACT|nr:SDR family oxidoreductase [Natronogracilivirga saccharolytica]MBP3193952.1 SDR family oxidoreductase [Natronogracilivirga saccharolytica]